MEKIAIVTDSAADLTKDVIEKYNIFVLPLRIIYKDKEYLDRIDITPKQVYDRLSTEIPHTSLPSMNDIDNLFSKLESEGYTHVINICISSGLSGTYGAIKLVSEQHPNLTFHLFDTKSLSMGTGAIVMDAAEMLRQGKTFNEIIEALPEIRNSIKVYYTIDTLEYLIKGGRIGKVSGTIGELLNIKPIISINEDGIYYTYAKARGRKQAISKLVDIALNELKTSKASIWIYHGDAYDDAMRVSKLFEGNPNMTKLMNGDISPALGVHTGSGLLGIGVKKEA